MKEIELAFDQIYFSDPLPDDIIIRIRVFYFNDYKSYGFDELVVQLSMLEKMLESYNRLCIRKRYFERKFYEELISLKFRPNTTLDSYLIGFLKFLISRIDIEDVKNKCSEGGCFIVAHVDLNSEESSGTRSLHYNQLDLSRDDKDPYRLIGELRYGAALTIPSKLRFLSEDEQRCFFRLVDIIHLAGDKPIHLTEFQLQDLWEQELGNVEKYSSGFPFNILERLFDFDLLIEEDVLIQNDGKTEKIEKEYFIRDYELYGELFQGDN